MEIDRKKARMWSLVGSTGTFGIAMTELVKNHSKLCVVTADLCSFSGLDRFKSDFPNNIYNVGIAEQNMIGVAAGLASEGLDVFAATYASFASARALDQVRNHMGYMKLPVKLVGLTAGFSTGILGATHMALEDISIFRSIPNITILSPADCVEEVKCLEAVTEYQEPVYIRLTGAKRMPMIYQEDYPFQIGKTVWLKQGKDICIAATGTVVRSAVKAAEKLEKYNISAAVVNIHTLKPMDKEFVDRLRDYRLIVTVEEHNIMGGLGGIIAEEISDFHVHPKLVRIGAEDYYPHAKTYNKLLEETGLSEDNISDRIMRHISDDFI